MSQDQELNGNGKRMQIANERGRVNMLRESMGLGEQEKGLVIADMRDIGAEEGMRAWKVASQASEKRWIALKLVGTRDDVI
jgi:hypothetical protein